MDIFKRTESPSESLIKEREAQGWQYAGKEGLTKTQFQTDARFLEVQYQTEEDIRRRYEECAQAGDFSKKVEVDLVLDIHTDDLQRLRKLHTEEEFQTLLTQLYPKQKNYFVFLREVH